MPKDKHPPYFAFYPDDFITDSAVDAMSNEELGMYVRLLCKAWKQDEPGKVPNDDRVLAHWAKANQRQWNRCKAGVLRAFTLNGDGCFHQKRMELEWQKVVAAIEAKAKAGSKGAKKRWQEHGTGMAQPSSCHSPAIGLPMANDSYTDTDTESEPEDVDVDGAIDISSSEKQTEIRAKANRFAKFVDCSKPDNRMLVAKVAILWASGELWDDACEQVLESFDAKREAGGAIREPAAWLYRTLANQCEKAGANFEQLLATTPVPPSLLWRAQ